MKLSENIKRLLGEQCGREFAVPNDCTVLALDIESKTGEHIGVNTIKRLLGFIDDEREPRVSTLNIIARYLGHDNWETLKLVDNRTGNSDFNESQGALDTAQLQPGAMVEITYQPDRRLVIKKAGGNEFTVVESLNSKLLAGDRLRLEHIVKDFPLLVSEVIRDGASLGTFTAGKLQGVNYKLL